MLNPPLPSVLGTGLSAGFLSALSIPGDLCLAGLPGPALPSQIFFSSWDGDFASLRTPNQTFPLKVAPSGKGPGGYCLAVVQRLLKTLSLHFGFLTPGSCPHAKTQGEFSPPGRDNAKATGWHGAGHATGAGSGRMGLSSGANRAVL